MNRINIVCLGVKDMAESIRFYRDGLGFATGFTGITLAYNVKSEDEVHEVMELLGSCI